MAKSRNNPINPDKYGRNALPPMAALGDNSQMYHIWNKMANERMFQNLPSIYYVPQAGGSGVINQAASSADWVPGTSKGGFLSGVMSTDEAAQILDIDRLDAYPAGGMTQPEYIRWLDARKAKGLQLSEEENQELNTSSQQRSSGGGGSGAGTAQRGSDNPYRNILNAMEGADLWSGYQDKYPWISKDYTADQIDVLRRAGIHPLDIEPIEGFDEQEYEAWQTMRTESGMEEGETTHVEYAEGGGKAEPLAYVPDDPSNPLPWLSGTYTLEDLEELGEDVNVLDISPAGGFESEEMRNLWMETRKKHGLPAEPLTIQEEDALAQAKDRVFASGGFQTTYETLEDAINNNIIKGTDLFTEENQVKVGEWLINTALGDYLAETGTKTVDQVADDLAKRWAALPYNTGNSYYGSGNKAAITREEFVKVLKQVKKDGDITALKDLILEHEAANDWGNYNQGTKDDKIIGRSKEGSTRRRNITEMTVDEIIKAAEDEMILE